jgi:hypothetical protein
MSVAASAMPQLERPGVVATTHETNDDLPPGTCPCAECKAERESWHADGTTARTTESAGADDDGAASRLDKGADRADAQDGTPPAAGGDEESALIEREYTDDQRAALAAKGQALANGAYPIADKADLQNAIASYGRAKNPAEVKAHIIKRAKALGCTDMLPDSWNIQEAYDPDHDGDDDSTAQGDFDRDYAGRTKESTGTDAGTEGTDALGRFAEATDAAVTKSGGSYEVTLIQEGMGNARDRRYYTKDALKEAARSGVFEGAQAYSDHPTATEAAELPERSIRGIVGHYSNVRYVDSGGRGELRATFTPVDGPAYQWVRDLIESSLKAKRPLLGLSINGAGTTEPFRYADGKTAYRVTSIAEVDSVDLVTKAGAGGTFLRRLAESMKSALRAPHQHTEVEMQQRIAAIVARLREAEPDSVASALADLEKLQFESASDDKLTEAQTRASELEQELADTKVALAEAEAKVEVYERRDLVESVLEEHEVVEGLREGMRKQLRRLPDKEAMVDFIESMRAFEDHLSAPLGAGVRSHTTETETSIESLGIPLKAEV